MTDQRNRLKSGAFAFADQMVVSAGTFLTLMIVSRNCSASDVGIFSLTWTVVSLLRTVQERLIAAPFVAFTYQPSYSRSTFRGSSIAHQLTFATVSAITIVLLSVLVACLDQRNFHFTLGISLAFALFFNLARDHMRAISYTDFAFSRLLALDSIIVISQLLCLLILGWQNVFTLTNVNLVIGTACIVPIIMWFRQFRTSFSFDRKLIASDWIHNWKYSRWLVGGRTIGIAPIIAIPWLIAFFQGEEGTGIYAVCSSVVGLSMMFVTGVNNLYQPKTVLEFQKNGVRGMTSVVIESVFIVSIVLTIISVIFWFFGDQVLRYYGANYAQYGYLAFLLSVSTLIISISGMAGNGLVALGKAKELFWGEVSYCVVTIVAAIILVPSHGLVGVGYSWILGSLTATTVTTIALIQSLHTHQQQLGPSESRVSLIRDEIPGA